MQFPVPQFTDVEDKIFGPLTLKQFGIIFAAGVVIFLGFSASKSVLVLIFLFMLFGLPALGLAFGKVNGRPIYNTAGVFFKFLTSPKVLVFHKEASSFGSTRNMKDAGISTKTEQVKVETVQDTLTHLQEVQELLQKTASQEREAAGKIR